MELSVERQRVGGAAKNAAHWNVETARAATEVFSEAAEQLRENAESILNTLVGLGTSEVWDASFRDTAIERLTEQLALADSCVEVVREWHAEVLEDLETLRRCRDDALDSGDAVDTEDAEVIVRRALSAIDGAYERLSGSTGTHELLPASIARPLALDVSVRVRIALGMTSVGAMVSELLSRFGLHAWEAIIAAIPADLLAGAGPLDAADVRAMLAQRSGSGGQPRIRTAASGAEIRRLYDALAAEGRDLEADSGPGIGVELPDGTRVRIREDDQPDASSIGVAFRDGRTVEVHVRS